MKRKHVKAGTSKEAAAMRKVLYAEAFVENGGHKHDAAVTAGYKPGRAADKAAERLSQDVAVQQLIVDRRASAIKAAEIETGLTVNGILREVRRLATNDPRKLFDKDGRMLEVHELDDDTAACISSVEIEEQFEGRGEEKHSVGFLKKLKLWDKNSALEKGMKHLGLFEKDNSQK